MSITATFRALVACLLLPLLSVTAPAARAGLVEIIAAAKPSIVLVGTFRATDSPRFTFRGTGFVVGDGRQIVTGAHVLPDARPEEGIAPALAVQVRRPDGALEARLATVQAVDRAHDVVVLRFDGDALPALTLADGGNVPEGQPVALIGFPIGGALGFTPVTHHGIVSSIAPSALPLASARQLNEATVRRLRSETFDVYQLDATAYPGNSGGPLLDAGTGQVIGVISFVFVKSTREAALAQPSGITYAIPIRHARALLSPGAVPNARCRRRPTPDPPSRRGRNLPSTASPAWSSG
jgi:serine protease Do